MARRSKQSPKSPKSMREQVEAKFRHSHLDLSSRHDAKVALGITGNRSTGKIHSLRTLKNYVWSMAKAGEWCRAQHGTKRLDAITPTMAQAYLDHRVDSGIGQKQLDADRMALRFGTGHTLPPVKSIAVATKPSRFYTRDQMQRIAAIQPPHYALATKLAFWSGLRAHELLTLKRGPGGSPERTWSNDRFAGREGGVRYTVIGKGKLEREVMLPPKLAEQLERLRHDSPRQVVDRGINYTQHYALGGGQAWSEHFSSTSKGLLGWSRGGHGLRHTFTQMRLKELQDYFRYDQARDILSQELGHFRRDVTLTYLR